MDIANQDFIQLVKRTREKFGVSSDGDRSRFVEIEGKIRFSA